MNSPEVKRPKQLAGIFEAVGSIGFIFSRKRGNTYSYPYLQYQDNDLRRVEGVKNLAGAGNLKPIGKSWGFRIMGSRVPAVTRQLYPFSPSKSTLFQAIELWDNAPNVADKSEIVELYFAQAAKKTEVRDYKSIVENPEFLTGVIDSRGALRCNSHDYQYLTVTSTNLALLIACTMEYGGNTTPTKASEKNLDFTEVKFFTWWLTKRDLVQRVSSLLVNSIRYPNGMIS